MTLGSLWDDFGVFHGHSGVILRASRVILRSSRDVLRSSRVILSSSRVIVRSSMVVLRSSRVVLRSSRVILRSLWAWLKVEKHVFVTKWVGKARNPKILIPIDAARPGDLENRGFRKKNLRKIAIFLFGVLRWSHLKSFALDLATFQTM